MSSKFANSLNSSSTNRENYNNKMTKRIKKVRTLFMRLSRKIEGITRPRINGDDFSEQFYQFYYFILLFSWELNFNRNLLIRRHTIIYQQNFYVQFM